jgi:hypothetical protein
MPLENSIFSFWLALKISLGGPVFIHGTRSLIMKNLFLLGANLSAGTC